MRGGRLAGLIVISGVVLAGVVVPACASLPGTGIQPGTAEVTREPFRSVIEATGVLEAAVSTQLGPPSIPDVWSHNLTFMMPEGRPVRAGQPVMKFDATKMQDKLRDSTARYETAVKQLEKEQNSLEVEIEELELDLVEARSGLERARLDAAVPRGLLSSIEASELELAETMATERVGFLERKIRARREQVAAQLRLLELKRTREEQRMAYFKEAVDKHSVPAPTDGVIVYIEKRGGGRWEIGESVWMLAKVLSVADLATLRVAAQVLEIDATRVRPGQSVSVTVDAIPGRVWKSRIESVGRLIRPRSEQDPGKVFDAFIPLDDVDRKKMRPGMSVRVEIEEQVLADALVVPIEAVREMDEGTVVTIDGDAGPEMRDVKVGPSDGRRIVILDGLSEGERVRTAVSPVGPAPTGDGPGGSGA